MRHLRRFFTSEHEHRLGRLLLKRLRKSLTLKEMENEQEKAPVSIHQYIIDIEFRMNHAFCIFKRLLLEQCLCLL